jgi:hypothetical protein
MKPLYALSGEWLALAERMDGAEDDAALPTAAELDALAAALDKKLEGCCMMQRNFQAEADALKAEADRLAARAKAAQNRADHLKGYMLGCMMSARETKLAAGVFALAIQKNSQPSVAVNVPVSALPERFQAVKIEPNKTAMLTAWKEGEKLPAGIEVTIGFHLRIR